jgi:lipoprotein-releasing system ATP-binding protein
MALIQTVNLKKTYQLGLVKVPVLRGVNLSVQPGEFVAILGASGSGKSTLLHLLGGLDAPDADDFKLLFDNRAINEMNAAQLDQYRRTDVGFVFQFYHLLPELNVLQNVTIAAMTRWGWSFGSHRSEVEKRATELLRSFGLGDRLRHRPVELSGGERQRVAIARALINGPRLILADEPTGNLDRKTGAGIIDLLLERRKAEGRTMIVVTHDPELAAKADRTVRMVSGVVE